MWYCAASICKQKVCLYLSPFVHEHVFECVYCVYTNMHAFSSLPQVGDNRMTAVKRAEESRGWDSVMDNDSQQAWGRAQPQALDSSPGEAGEVPARKTPHSSGWRGKLGANKDVKQEQSRMDTSVCVCWCVCVCVHVCMGGCVWMLHQWETAHVFMASGHICALYTWLVKCLVL